MLSICERAARDRAAVKSRAEGAGDAVDEELRVAGVTNEGEGLAEAAETHKGDSFCVPPQITLLKTRK